ncbi:signal peptidase I [Miniphocaeibacter halophilus]|uniref:Signal peptidase I n=1 Tax=Miniphocaeibacter halophilus TaxID=2931922 RepID=A0AC61MS09_9FIRM|nr:signal peptidase I [Miniphocaeibacter halophilus]QQK07649.1 signal peptidase I [Miniphocaeibacter halophilus]
MNKNNKEKSEFLEWIFLIVFTLALAILINTFVLSLTIVKGSSMEPTLKTNDRLLINKISFLVDNIEYGDIVEFHNPYNKNDENYIKRVIALEGDIVEIIENRVYVNQNLLDENYTSTKGETKIKSEYYWEIQEDEVFVLGDNRPKSEDSRAFGPIKKNSIVGIAFFRFYPFNKFGSLNIN